MISLHLPRKKNDPISILCLGAHADDIEIGCGGTLLQLCQDGLQVKFYWVVFTAAGRRNEEAQRAASRLTAGCDCEIVIKDFRDGFLPYTADAVKEVFEELKGSCNPDLIFTHWQCDAHQDHRLINELTWNTFRNHWILEYEIPKYDGDMGRPNVFVPLQNAVCNQKIEILCEVFESQRSKQWFTPETFLGLMRLRGMESNSPSGYAEAFYARKISLTGVSDERQGR